MDKSPLARLPPELRNRIYEFAFTLPLAKNYRSLSDHIKEHNGLTRTCRQLRSESRLLFFRLNHFWVCICLNADYEDGRRVLKALGAYVVSRIGSVRSCSGVTITPNVRGVQCSELKRMNAARTPENRLLEVYAELGLEVREMRPGRWTVWPAAAEDAE